jgi:uroporphyrinogen III methyltransferase/synthase
VLPEELKKMGAEVTVVEAYQTVIPTTSRSQFFQILHEKPVDLIVFASSSTVANLAEIVQPSPLLEVLQGIPVACIGPITSDTVRQLGLEVSVSPTRYDIPSLVQAITDFFA